MKSSIWGKSGRFLTRLVLVGLILLGLPAAGGLRVAAEEPETGTDAHAQYLQQGKEAFYKGRKMFYNNEAGLAEITATLESSKECFDKLEDCYDKYYWQSQADFVAAEADELYKEFDQAEVKFVTSGRLARKALQYDPKSSEAHRLLADSKMRLMVFKGPAFLMVEGPMAFFNVRQAIGCDRMNYAAQNSMGMYFLNAPFYGGGNVNLAIRSLNQALESKDEFDNFITYSWLGKAYQRKNNLEESESYYRKALEIYPNSPWIEFLKTYSIWNYSSHRQG